MSVRHQTQVSQGSTVTLEVSYYNYAGGSLTNPDTTPTYTIYDPANVVKTTGTGTYTSVGKYQTTYTVASDATISQAWRIEWSARINTVLVPDNWEYFQVVPSGSTSLNEIIISDAWIQQIKTVLAYPEVESVLLSDEQIKSLIVRPALHDYFVKFPLKYPAEYTIINETILDFPDDFTFGVMSCSVLGKGYAGSPGGTFWDIVMWNQQGFSSNFRSMYGSKVKGYNPGSLRQLRFLDSMTNNSLINQGTFKYRVDQILKKLYVFSSISAKMNVVWAKYSNNFNDVFYQFQYDVVKLAKGYLCLHLADTTGIVDDSVLEAKIDVSALRERGNNLLTEVNEKWLLYPDPLCVIH